MTFINRYLITLVSNIVRAGLNFIVSLSVAKYLQPELYGEYQYVLSMTTAMLLVVNMGTESAYFTFISQKKQNVKFHLYYFIWQFIQILLVLLFMVLLSENLYQYIFKDISSSIVFIAFIAMFFVGNIQNSINHIVESLRQTHFSQIISIFIAIIHLILVLSLIGMKKLNIELLFLVLLFEYILYTGIMVFIFKKYKFEITSNDTFDLKEMITSFYNYSKHLFILSIIGFVYVFVDRWLIQTYVGSEGQAFFSIASQFSALIMIVTSSILKVFWKEIAESIENNDVEKTKRYYIAVSKNLYIFTLVVSSTLFYFSDSVLKYFYGDTYLDASLVFKLMMLYPIFQSMGQLYSSFYQASSQTKLYSKIAYFISIASVGVAFFFLSPYGLKIGEEGIAIKFLIMGILVVFVYEYYIMKYLELDMDYLYKIKYFLVVFLVSYGVFKLQVYLNFSFLVQVLMVSFLYIFPIAIYLFKVLKDELSN